MAPVIHKLRQPKEVTATVFKTKAKAHVQEKCLEGKNLKCVIRGNRVLCSFPLSYPPMFLENIIL